MNYTENLSLGLPEYGESADVAALNRNSGILDAYVYNTRQIECEPYDSTKTYMSGDLAIHNEVIYECNTDNTTGTWDDSKWDSTTLAEQIAKAKQMGGESALADLEDVEITNPSTGQALLFDDDDDVWKNQNLPDVSVTKEASGNPVEFSDAADAPLVKCVTEIQGSQDLHGYDKPWVGGAGKNKLPLVLADIKSNNTSGTWSGNAYTVNGVTITVLTDESDNVTGIKFNGTANSLIDFIVGGYFYISASTQYILNGVIGGGTTTYRLNLYKLISGGTEYITQSLDGDSQSVALSNSDIFHIHIYVNQGVQINTTIYPMLRISTETSTFQLYSNICPITAYTEGEIEVSDGDGNTTTHTTTYPTAIYRGSEDVVNGEVVSKWPLYSFGDLTWNTRYTGSVNKTLSANLPYQYDGTNCKIISEDLVYIRSVAGASLLSDPDSKAVGIYGYEYGVSNTDVIYLVIPIDYTPSCNYAYELATPSTSSVTPTNLPIKSLSGYNHIESSTGDMEIEYITQNYQPLVDLIQSGNGHTYSTSEQVVGKWIDGRPIYERTFEVNNITSDGVQTLDATGTPSNIQMVPGCSVVMRTRGTYNTDYGVSIASEQSGCRLISNSNGLGVSIVGYAMFTSQYGTCTVWALVRYVKASDAVQTCSINAPLTSQKAQIEHLTDKTEEVPTEEEKAVNEEENTNENR